MHIFIDLIFQIKYEIIVNADLWGKYVRHENDYRIILNIYRKLGGILIKAACAFIDLFNMQFLVDIIKTYLI